LWRSGSKREFAELICTLLDEFVAMKWWRRQQWINVNRHLMHSASEKCDNELQRAMQISELRTLVAMAIASSRIFACQ